MKIHVSNHTKMRAKERVKGVTNGDEAIKFIRKEFKKILKDYKNGDSEIRILTSKYGSTIIENKSHKFYYTRDHNNYTIHTYYDNGPRRGKDTSRKMASIRKYMREQNGVYGFNKNNNNY